MAEGEVFVRDDLTTGIDALEAYADREPSIVVESLHWESGFRGTALRPGDAIVAVDGVSVAKLLEDKAALQGRIVGQYLEPEVWKEAGRKEGDPVTLTVRRRAYPEGIETEDVRGELRHKRDYRNAENQPLLWPEGPDQYEKDGFDVSWPVWTETLTKQLVWTRCGGWQRDSVVTRHELEGLLAHADRVKLLGKKYAGAFADAVTKDFEAAVESMQGSLYELTDVDLAYRRADDARAEEIAGLAKTAWEKVLKKHADEIVPAFPAEHPVLGDRAKVIGRCVLLERIPNENWIAEAGHNYLVAGDDDQGWYSMDAESDPAFRMFRAVRRYQQLVSPGLTEEYTVLARVLDEARIIVINEVGRWGHTAEPLAALVGDSMFVDLAEVKDGESPFAGEVGLLKPTTAMPADDASPREVLEAMIATVKAGDMTTWKALFAPHTVSAYGDGTVSVNWYWSELGAGEWEASRQTIESRCYDARVVWTGDAYVVASGDEDEALPKIEMVDAEIEHVGLFDGKYRAFEDIIVHRNWRLQRMDGGPWRIASAQSI